MAISGELAVDGAAQIEVADDGGRAQVEDLLDGLFELAVVDLAGAERLNKHAHGMRNADGVGELDLALVGKARGHNVLSDIARGVSGTAVDLRRVLAGECAAAVRGAAAVGVDDDLAAGQAAVALRAADDEAAGRVNINLGVLVHQLRGNGRLDDKLDHVLADLLKRRLRRVLGGEDDRVDADGLAALVVLDRHLRLAVGTEIVDKALLAHVGQLLCHLMGKGDRERHELRGLGAGVAEHHALVARAVVELARAAFLIFKGVVDAHRDIAALLVDVRDNAAGVTVKAVLRAVIADVADDVARDLRDVDIAARGDLAHDVDKAGGDGRLAGHAAVGVFFKDRVEHRIGDLVADLVGMPLGDGFGGE